jgi:hypothetical protein
MKTKFKSAQRGGMEIWDVVALVAAIFVVAAVVLPMIAKSRARSRAGRISCSNNLKQIWISFHVWSADNGSKMPMQLSTNDGGTKELIAGGAVFPHFLAMSNELSTPKILRCAWDEKRRMTSDFGTLRDTNISYFLALDAQESFPGMWLVGDRNLATNGVSLRSGLFKMPAAKAEWSWSGELHQKKGYICQSDGSVSLTGGDGRAQVSVPLHASVTNALRAYFDVTTNTSFRLAIP